MNGDFAIDAGAVRAPPGESPLTADTRELVQSLESEWRDALCAKDMGKLQSLIHPRFVLIATRGSGPFVMSRDEWLEAIQKRALEEGLPYQTLISSLLHKFASGRLKETESA